MALQYEMAADVKNYEKCGPAGASSTGDALDCEHRLCPTQYNKNNSINIAHILNCHGALEPTGQAHMKHKLAPFTSKFKGTGSSNPIS